LTFDTYFHAVSYNRRHRRHGHLFQNRYKSIICEKENINIAALKTGSRRRETSMVRHQIAEILVEQHGLSLAEAGRQLGVSAAAIAKALRKKSE